MTVWLRKIKGHRFNVHLHCRSVIPNVISEIFLEKSVFLGNLADTYINVCLQLTVNLMLLCKSELHKPWLMWSRQMAGLLCTSPLFLFVVLLCLSVASSWLPQWRQPNIVFSILFWCLPCFSHRLWTLYFFLGHSHWIGNQKVFVDNHSNSNRYQIVQQRFTWICVSAGCVSILVTLKIDELVRERVETYRVRNI